MSDKLKWIKRGKRLPKKGNLVGGSYRNGEWSMSSITREGWDFIDSDRTHYIRIPKPPKP